LTPVGETQGAALRAALAGREFVGVLSSPRRRALRTAELAGLSVTGIDEDLAEWNYGSYEGITTAEIHTREPTWDLWHDGCPGGESPAEVGARLDRVLDRAKGLLAEGDVALVGHGHALRAAGVRWPGLPIEHGGMLMLDTATISVLGYEHGKPAIHHWNATTVR
jgi:probable phosphoglycerate mutase